MLYIDGAYQFAVIAPVLFGEISAKGIL